MTPPRRVRTSALTSLRLDLDRATKEPTSPQDFQKNVFQALECPVCLEIAVPPVILCTTGHFVCGICRKGLGDCVICHRGYTDTRNYAIENIVSKIEVKCRYNDCDKVQNVADLQEHLKCCDYRPIECSITNNKACHKERIDFDQFVEHLISVHGAKQAPVSGISKFVVSKSIAKIIIEEQRKESRIWSKRLHLHDGAIFILNMLLEESVVYFWISAMLSEIETTKYHAVLHIGQLLAEKIDQEKMNVKWAVGVSPVHEVFEDVKLSGDYAAFPAKCLLRLSGTKTDADALFIFFVRLKLRKV